MRVERYCLFLFLEYFIYIFPHYSFLKQHTELYKKRTVIERFLNKICVFDQELCTKKPDWYALFSIFRTIIEDNFFILGMREEIHHYI